MAEDTGTGFEGTPEEALPSIESVSVVTLDFPGTERWLGVTMKWSDDIYTYGFCCDHELNGFLDDLARSREAATSAGKDQVNAVTFYTQGNEETFL